MGDTSMLDGSQPLFQGYTFTIIPNSLPDDRRHQLAEDISAAGGTVNSFDALNGRINKLEEITHIISMTSDFPDYHRALDLFIHTVKPAWIDACLKVGKVKNPRTYSPDPALYMSEVVVCCGDIPSGDKEAITGGIVAMGGQYTHQLSKQVTHLIVLNMADSRAQLATSKRLNIAILLPHWFDDCLKIGRRISERPYRFPDPEILNVEAGAIPPTKASAQIRDATNPEPSNDPFPPASPERSEPAKAIKAFSGKKIMLGGDLPLSGRLKGVVTELIQAGGGKITSNVDEAHIYVCNYRDGADYIKASQENKDVGNLSWLYYLITYDIWTNPMRRMMHYPRPRDGIPGFADFKISISSYTGEARIYLENLVKASGAEFTKTFKQDNTHLVTAHTQSEKCDAAKEWGVNVVNHLWLEESYARCKEQTLTDSRYTYFPSRTNFGEILGQTEIDHEAVEKNFFSKTRKIKPTKPVIPPDNAPASSAARRTTSDPVARSSPLVEKTKRTKTATDIATPSRRGEGKENQTPGTAGSRGAKDRALSKLHNSASDIAQFEKEMKRKGGVIHGGRRDKEAEIGGKPTKSKGRDSNASKRSIDEVDAEDESTDDEVTEETVKKNKRAKKERLVPIKYRMLLSKIERWTDNPDKESKDKARLREIGLYITDDFKNVDLLCAPKVVRTKKFVSAMACGPALVSDSYIDYALKHNKLPPPDKHPLTDHDFEKSMGLRLVEAVERAKTNRHRLLKDWTIFCTPNVNGTFDTYRDIIQANGGQCNLWKGRGINVTASKRSINTSNEEVSQNQEEDEGDVLYLISEAKKSEFPLWVKFRELARKHDMVPRIVKTEWVIFVALAQYVHWKPEWELNEETVNAIGS